MTEEEKAIGDVPYPPNGERTWYEMGCIGVTHSLLQKSKVDWTSKCYKSESQAVAMAMKEECPKDERGSIFAIRFNDPLKGDHDKLKDDAQFPVNRSHIRGTYPGGTPGHFDYGYRQQDGSFIHANNATPGMVVYLSPTSKEYSNQHFDTTLYCVTCCKCKR